MIKRYFTLAQLACALTLVARTAATLFWMDHSTGYGEGPAVFTAAAAWMLAAAMVALHLAVRGRLREDLPAGGSAGGAGGLILAAGGFLLLCCSALQLLQLLRGGALGLLFTGRAELMEMGVSDLSFRWSIASCLLGLPGGVWLLRTALWSLPGDREPRGGQYLAALYCLGLLCRSVALYMQSGGNPNDQVSAAQLAVLLAAAVLAARFGGYLATGRRGSSARDLLPIAPLALLAAAAAAPACISLLLSGRALEAGLCLSNCLFSLYCFLAAKRLNLGRAAA